MECILFRSCTHSPWLHDAFVRGGAHASMSALAIPRKLLHRCCCESSTRSQSPTRRALQHAHSFSLPDGVNQINRYIFCGTLKRKIRSHHGCAPFSWRERASLDPVQLAHSLALRTAAPKRSHSVLQPTSRGLGRVGSTKVHSRCGAACLSAPSSAPTVRVNDKHTEHATRNAISGRQMDKQAHFMTVLFATPSVLSRRRLGMCAVNNSQCRESAQ